MLDRVTLEKSGETKGKDNWHLPYLPSSAPDSSHLVKRYVIDNLIIQHRSAVIRYSFLETIAILEFLGGFGFVGLF